MLRKYLKNKLILSPMAGITDIAFRLLAKKYGADIVFTEFVSSKAILMNNKKTINMLKTIPEEKPVGVQLFGNDPEILLKAAKRIEDYFDIIDINIGCSVQKVIKTGSGSALLNNPEKIAIIISKLVKHINKPITIKTRLGVDKNSINIMKIAKIAKEKGASAITIHGRTQKDNYKVKADWDYIKEVKKKFGTKDFLVFGNGDVLKPEDFKEKINYSKVDAVYIARGAIGNPAFFKEAIDYYKKGVYEKINKIELFKEYYLLAKKFNLNFTQIKSSAISFSKGFEGSKKIRELLTKTKDLKEIEEIFNIK